MRHLILMRHGMPAVPPGSSLCLGRTDLPLSPLGRMQACLLAEELSQYSTSFVYSSPLLRSTETAMAFSRPLRVVDAFAEQNMGCWDGLSFEEIRHTWPELYEKRGKDPLLVPPEAETLSNVQQRAVEELKACLNRFPGDMLITSHASVIQCIMAKATGTPLAESRQYRLPYGGYAVLEGEESMRLQRSGILPHPEMTASLAEKLLSAAALGRQIETHCRAVAEKALEIAEALPFATDREALHCAALLHDAARSEPQHAHVGADWLHTLGYDQIARLIRQHHDPESDASSEALILFISDKCVQEDRIVPLEERFEKSAERCRDETARAAHARRWETARQIRQQLNHLCGREIIP